MPRPATARAVKNTEQDLGEELTATLELAARDGIAKANPHVKILEETVDPGRAEELLARQPQRAFFRIARRAAGMTRLDALVDDARATVIDAAIDQHVSACLRARQFDVARFAELYLNASAERRDANFTAQVLYSAPLDETEDAGLAESVHGTRVPRTILAEMGNPASQLLEHIDGQPVRLDGKPLDQNPAATGLRRGHSTVTTRPHTATEGLRR